MIIKASEVATMRVYGPNPWVYLCRAARGGLDPIVVAADIESAYEPCVVKREEGVRRRGREAGVWVGEPLVPSAPGARSRYGRQLPVNLSPYRRTGWYVALTNPPLPFSPRGGTSCHPFLDRAGSPWRALLDRLVELARAYSAFDPNTLIAEYVDAGSVRWAVILLRVRGEFTGGVYSACHADQRPIDIWGAAYTQLVCRAALHRFGEKAEMEHYQFAHWEAYKVVKSEPGRNGTVVIPNALPTRYLVPWEFGAAPAAVRAALGV